MILFPTRIPVLSLPPFFSFSLPLAFLSSPCFLSFPPLLASCPLLVFIYFIFPLFIFKVSSCSVFMCFHWLSCCWFCSVTSSWPHCDIMSRPANQSGAYRGRYTEPVRDIIMFILQGFINHLLTSDLFVWSCFRCRRRTWAPWRKIFQSLSRLKMKSSPEDSSRPEVRPL